MASRRPPAQTTVPQPSRRQPAKERRPAAGWRSTRRSHYDEPTPGIDVGAKYEIYVLMKQVCGKRRIVIMISSNCRSARTVLTAFDHLRGPYQGEFNPETVLRANDQGQRDRLTVEPV
jgi:ABC-type histidine transport system ATPase subunit